MKRTLTITVAALALSGLTACGSDSPKTSSTSSTSTASSSSSSPSTTTSSTTTSSTAPTTSTSASSATSASSSSSADAAIGDTVDDAGLVAIAKKAGCTTATALPPGAKGQAAGMATSVECKGAGKSELMGFRTTSPAKLAGALKALNTSAKGNTLYLVKGANWVVMQSEDGQNPPTKAGTEALQKKIGAGTVATAG